MEPIDPEIAALEGLFVTVGMRRHPWRPGDDPALEPTLRDKFFWHLNSGTDWVPALGDNA